MGKTLSKQRALEIIRRFDTSRVLVVGDIMVDHFIWGKVSRISPEAPVPVVKVTSENLLLGGSSNVLNNVFSIGGKASITGVIGADEMGTWTLNRLKELAIDTEGIIIEREKPTIVKTRIVAHNQQVVRFDREDKKAITPKGIRKITRYIEKMRGQIGAIVVSDYNKGLISEMLLEEIRRIIADTNIALCIDPKQNGFSLYRNCDLITPNTKEAEQALGTELVTTEDIMSGGTTLLESFGFKSVLITRGEEGMALFERDGTVTPIPAVAQEVYDVTGAGDTVIGIFALAVAAGATFREAAVLANHAAGIVVGKVGTATVTQDELIRVLKRSK